jgi:hypothetical protein
VVATLPFRFGLTSTFLQAQKVTKLLLLKGFFHFERPLARRFSITALLRVTVAVLGYHFISIY